MIYDSFKSQLFYYLVNEYNNFQYNKEMNEWIEKKWKDEMRKKYGDKGEGKNCAKNVRMNFIILKA